MGYHIVELLERKALEPYSEKRAEILTYLKQKGIEEVAAQREIERRIEASRGRLTREEVLAQAEAEVVEKDPTLRYLLREYYDGLLLIAISQKAVWNEANYKEEELAKYFSSNKKLFRWNTPRFKGYVMHLHDPNLAKLVKQWMKRNAFGNWASELDSTFNKDSAMVRITEGIYRQGDNPYVDHLVYKQAEAKPTARFPYVSVVGKKLKQPKVWTDDKATVIESYRKVAEESWVKSLRKQYPVEINESLLSEIKSH